MLVVLIKGLILSKCHPKSKSSYIINFNQLNVELSTEFQFLKYIVSSEIKLLNSLLAVNHLAAMQLKKKERKQITNFKCCQL